MQAFLTFLACLVPAQLGEPWRLVISPPLAVLLAGLLAFVWLHH